jgi:hypothetical protein
VTRPALLHVGFTGTRRGLAQAQYEALWGYVLRQTRVREYVTGHHGMCTGADDEFNSVAQDMGWRTHGHPPLDQSRMADMLVDEQEEPKEFLDRNRDIVIATQYLIACPHTVEEQWRGSGTWQAIRYAEKLGRPVVYIWPDGRVTPQRAQVKGA